MPPFPFVLEKTAQKIIDITLSPTRNVFESMLLIITGDGEPGIHEWVNKVRSDMTKRELENHKLALIGFFYVLFPDEGQITFPAYLNNLEQTDATVLRDKMLNAYASIKKKGSIGC